MSAVHPSSVQEAARIRAASRVDQHRLYVPPRIIGSCLAAVLLAIMHHEGEALPFATTSILVPIVAWPIVMYALRFPFPSNRAADLLQFSDGLAIGALLGATQAQAFLLHFLGYILSAAAIGGFRAFVAAAALSTSSCAAVLLATGGHLQLHRDLSHADVAGGIGFALYAFFVAHLGYGSRKKLLQTRRELGTLSRDLEQRVDERTKTLASTNAAISRFVPQEFLRALGHDDVSATKLGQASARDVTVLFADIRNFTTLSERMSPEETFGFLNSCLSRLGPHVRAQSGFIDKYIGDAIMALFLDSPADAVRAAMAMQREVSTFNTHAVGGEPLAIGIGVHTGRVMMGTIGEEQRFEATVISDAVNLTARLETLTKQLGCSMLITADVAKHLNAEHMRDVRPLGTFAMKGKSQAIEVFEVFSSDDDALRAAKRAAVVPSEQALALYKQGDHVEALRVLGSVVEASPNDGPMAWWLRRMQRDLAFEGPPSGRDVVRLDDK